MALKHADSGEVIDIAPFGNERLENERSVALFKSKDLEVIRLVMQEKEVMPMHQVSGEITIQCLEGAFEILMPHGSQVLKHNQMIFLQGGEPHIVRAIESCSVLVTIVLKHTQTVNNIESNETK